MVRRRTGWSRLLALAAATALAAPQVAGQPQDLWFEAEIAPAQVYVQAQAIYRLRFFQAVDVQDLKIALPSTRLADLRPIGSERVYEAVRDGRRYRVHESTYALFPFGSGALELSGAHATGRVAAVAATAADGRRSVRIEAPARTLTVRPMPAAATAASDWLPAHRLTMSESWAPAATEARPGQALRRTIRIEASGIDAAQIPALKLAAPGMMVDPEPARLENRIDGERNIGVREQTFRMVALRAGGLVVPELRLSWWNLDTDAPARATLPARALRIAAADTAQAAATAPINMPPKVVATVTALPDPQRWPLPLLLGAAFMLIGGAMAYAYARRRAVRAAWRLQRACRMGSAGAVRDGLLSRAAAVWPLTPPLTLEALGQRLPDPAARHALGAIERSLYGPNAGPSDRAALRAMVRAVQRSIGQAKRRGKRTQ